MTVSDHAHRGLTLAGSAVLVVGGLALAFVSRGPLGHVASGETDTPDAALVLAAVPLLALAVTFVAQGIRAGSVLAGAPVRRVAAAALLVGAVQPFDHLGSVGWLGNVGMAVAAVMLLRGAPVDRDGRA